MKVDKTQQLKDIRRAYILAKALNIQYLWIREFLDPELKKAANNAKASNSFFIKHIEDAFKKKSVTEKLVDDEEERAFRLLEELEKLDIKD
jgi:hypothetical protein